MQSFVHAFMHDKRIVVVVKIKLLFRGSRSESKIKLLLLGWEGNLNISEIFLSKRVLEYSWNDIHTKSRLYP